MKDETNAGLYRDKVHHVLVSGRLYEELKPLADRMPDYSFLFKAENELTDDDFNWADAYTAFKPASSFRFGRIKWVHAMGAGVDAFLSSAEWPDDVLLTRTVGPFGRKIAEYVAGHILANHQRHDVFRDSQSQRRWQPVPPSFIRGCRIVVYGTGAIGRETASLLSALGASVCGVSASGTAKSPFDRVVRTNDADEILGQARWIVNTMPLTEHTRSYFNAKWFGKLSEAGFINVGRGGSVDHDALLHALDNGALSFAVLDVFAEEPLPESSPLWGRPDIFITPHISALTTAEDAMESFVETAEQLRAGITPVGLVNTKRGY